KTMRTKPVVRASPLSGPLKTPSIMRATRFMFSTYCGSTGPSPIRSGLPRRRLAAPILPSVRLLLARPLLLRALLLDQPVGLLLDLLGIVEIARPHVTDHDGAVAQQFVSAHIAQCGGGLRRGRILRATGFAVEPVREGGGRDAGDLMRHMIGQMVLGLHHGAQRVDHRVLIAYPFDQPVVAVAEPYLHRHQTYLALSRPRLVSV